MYKVIFFYTYSYYLLGDYMFWKNLLKFFIIGFSSIIILNLIITLLNYIGLINIMIVNIFKYIIPFISLFISGIYIGKNSLNKGWLEGLKLGLIFIFFIFIIDFIFYSLSLKQLILYGIILIGSILGSMIGINTKKS